MFQAFCAGGQPTNTDRDYSATLSLSRPLTSCRSATSFVARRKMTDAISIGDVMGVIAVIDAKLKAVSASSRHGGDVMVISPACASSDVLAAPDAGVSKIAERSALAAHFVGRLQSACRILHANNPAPTTAIIATNE